MEGGIRGLATITRPESFTQPFDFEFAVVGDQLRVFANRQLIISAENSNLVERSPSTRLLFGNGGPPRCRDKGAHRARWEGRPIGTGRAESLDCGVGGRAPAALESGTRLSPARHRTVRRGPARKHQEVWAKQLGIPVEETNSIGMKLVLIPPGEYEMGITKEEMEALTSQVIKEAPWVASIYAAIIPRAVPKHRVRLHRAFQLGACEVTREQFQQFVEETGYRTYCEDSIRPSVNWDFSGPDRAVDTTERRDMASVCKAPPGSRRASRTGGTGRCLGIL